MTDLPWMGLGLSTNLGERDRPDPWRLHDESPDLFDFVEYSAPLSLKRARREAARFPLLEARLGELPAILHPVHLNLWGPELESERNLEALAAHLEAVRSPWVSDDVAWWHRSGAAFPGYFYVAPPFDEAAIPSCVAHALHVQRRLPVPLLLENPAVLHRSGGLHVLDFFARLHRETGLPLLLDLGHLLAFQLLHDLPPDAGLERFPLDRVVEIHVAGGAITERDGRRFYVDDHGQPVREEVFRLLEAILPACTGLRAIAFEADGHPEPVARQTLARLRALLAAAPVGAAGGSRRNEGAAPSGVAIEGAPPPATRAGRESRGGEAAATVAPAAGAAKGAPPLPAETGRIAWALFDRVHAGEVPGEAEDAAGLLVEAEIRWALLAQELDRDWPLSRAYFAGRREDLRAFARSPEYRSRFDGSGRGLGRVFAAWARRRVREGEGAGAAIVAFESWCHGLLAAPRPAGPGQVALGEGRAVGTFPADLSELLYAVKALRRHLGDRARTSGRYEESALDALRQIAGRIPSRPWPVAVRRVGGRLEVEPLAPAAVRLLRELGRGQAPEALEPPLRTAFDRAVAEGLLRIG